MINRIRDIRRQKGLTLADVAARCAPPTTAQTIGRLETGMRSLSLGWMNRIAAALDVDPPNPRSSRALPRAAQNRWRSPCPPCSRSAPARPEWW
jgi:transcriptional regulator with XRE-family HTH domain